MYAVIRGNRVFIFSRNVPSTMLCTEPHYVLSEYGVQIRGQLRDCLQYNNATVIWKSLESISHLCTRQEVRKAV